MKHLFYSEEPEEGGIVLAEPYIECGQYPDGEIVTLRAESSKDWMFSHWAERGHNPFTQPMITVYMTEDRAIAAHFYKKRST